MLKIRTAIMTRMQSLVAGAAAVTLTVGLALAAPSLVSSRSVVEAGAVADVTAVVKMVCDGCVSTDTRGIDAICHGIDPNIHCG